MTTIGWIGSFKFTETRPDEARVCDALERQGADVIRIDQPWDNLDRYTMSTDIDWLIFSKCDELAGRRFAALARRARPRLAQVLFDLMDFREQVVRGIPALKVNRLKWWIPMGQRMDVVFSKELGNFDRYSESGIQCVYLDQGVDPYEQPVASSGQAKTTDVAFFGRWSAARERVLATVAQDAKVTVYTRRPRPWGRSGFRIQRYVTGDALARAIASAQLVWGESATHDVAGYWSDRRYLVMGRGGCFVTRYTEGVEMSFSNNENIAWYHSPLEGAELLQSLLSNEQRTRQIAQNAAVHVHRHHTYDIRARRILQVLGETP